MFIWFTIITFHSTQLAPHHLLRHERSHGDFESSPGTPRKTERVSLRRVASKVQKKNHSFMQRSRSFGSLRKPFPPQFFFFLLSFFFDGDTRMLSSHSIPNRSFHGVFLLSITGYAQPRVYSCDVLVAPDWIELVPPRFVQLLPFQKKKIISHQRSPGRKKNQDWTSLVNSIMCTVKYLPYDN